MKYEKIIVTGGSSGLGLALATHYSSTGATVALVARNQEKLEQTAHDIHKKTGNKVLLKSLDVSDSGNTKIAINALIDELGGLDLLINSAGIMKEGYFDTLPIEDFQKIMSINLFGSINVIKAALPTLKSHSGKVVNIASLGGFIGPFGYTAYSASKFALVGFSESLRYELKPYDVTVQLICPPEFDSPMVDELETYRTPENRVQVLTVPKAPLEDISKSTIKAIDGSSFICFTGFKTKAVAILNRLLPGVLRFNSDRLIRSKHVDRP